MVPQKDAGSIERQHLVRKGQHSVQDKPSQLAGMFGDALTWRRLVETGDGEEEVCCIERKTECRCCHAEPLVCRAERAQDRGLQAGCAR